MSYTNQINTNTHEIFKFLEEHSVEHGQPHTHTSMFNPRGSYFIKNNEIDNFYELYEKALFDGIELHITEKHEEISPMVIDLDFKYELETYTRKHTEEHIKKIIELYNNEISNIFQIEKDDPKMASFVFQRDNMYKAKGVTKDGIHILYPFIVNHSVAFYYIRENILKKIGTIINELSFKNVISDVVDRSVISPNTLWLLYGSNKEKPKGDPYKLAYIYDGLANKLEINDYFDFNNQNINLAKFFSIRGRKESDIIQIREDKVSLIDTSATKKKISKKLSTLSYDFNEVKELVNMLSNDRAENYAQWLELGWALHNIDPNSDDLLELWIDFSKRSSKFQEGVCEKEWDRSRNEGLTIRCLYYWAKIDNYPKYMEFKNRAISPLVDEAIRSQTNDDVARVLYKMKEYEFVYCDQEWYMYKNHKWTREPNGIELRKLISESSEGGLCGIFAKRISQNNALYSSGTITEEERNEIKQKNTKIIELTNKLKTTAFKDNIMKECRDKFSNNTFVKKLDSNPFLLGFTNGVYDLQKGELRDGRPEDYICMSTEIEKIDFDENHEYWEDLKHFIETVFYEPEIKEYFMGYLASCLQGHNAEEKFRVWNGRGCHAIDTDIMMYDGTFKKVQDIIKHDQLMGDDMTPRNVIELKRGYSNMYNIYGEGFDAFIVNGDHILCLVNELTKVIEISVDDYIKLDDDIKKKHFLYDMKHNTYSFDIEYKFNDNYYGFELDNNHRYIMGNGIVTHNSNGKSKLLELFVHALGQYSIKFPVTMITGKRVASNAASPELVRSKGCRFGYLEEPGENERIEVGFLKELTGGDKITARGLHKEPIDFKPQFKLALLCNEIPKVPPNDSGTWRRMEVIEFKSHFVENPKEVGEFPIDKQLSEKLKNWKELFMAMLLDVYYVKYKHEGLTVPEEITRFTTEYQKTCDLYIDFIVDNIEETKDNTDSVDLHQFYDEFKIWYEDSFGNHKYPTKIEFKKYLKKKYSSKRMSQTDIKGFRFRIKYDKQGNILSPSYLVGRKIQPEEMKPENLISTIGDRINEEQQLIASQQNLQLSMAQIQTTPTIPLELSKENIIQINNKSVVKLEHPISVNEFNDNINNVNNIDVHIVNNIVVDQEIINDDFELMTRY